jgi:hypothetical protein
MGGLNAEMLGSLLREITESAEKVLTAAAIARALSRATTPEEESLSRQTEDVLHGLIETARTYPTAATVRALQHTLDALGTDRTKPSKSPATAPRRKRSTA